MAITITATGTPKDDIRKFNLRYRLDDPRYVDLERLKSLVPYGQGNEIFLEAMLIGARALLKEEDAKVDAHTSSVRSAEPMSPSPAARAILAPVMAASVPPAAAAKVESAKGDGGYSAAAISHFSSYGGDPTAE